jgi:hypothetical protein
MLSLTIRLAGRRIHLVRQTHDCDVCENHAAHVRLAARPFLRLELNSAAHGDAAALAAFRDLAATYGVLDSVHRVIDSEILAHVAWLLETGRLIAVECRVPVQANPMEAPAAPKSTGSRPRPRIPVPVDEPIKTWVEIELLDDAGKPVANEKYLVTVPEGVVKSGNLDAKGRARITNIDPGTCEISFPDIDGREWKPK